MVVGDHGVRVAAGRCLQNKQVWIQGLTFHGIPPPEGLLIKLEILKEKKLVLIANSVF